MKEHIDTITDLLLGAAYADKRLEGDELSAISKMLCTVLQVNELPGAQKNRLSSFNPAKFDAKAAATSLHTLGDEDKRTVIELVASVHDADDELDFAEDEYLRKVAQGLGLSEDEIKDLTIELLDDDELDGLLVDHGDDKD
jgi:uncharacterized tellurite resistance protein B-like protein